MRVENAHCIVDVPINIENLKNGRFREQLRQSLCCTDFQAQQVRLKSVGCSTAPQPPIQSISRRIGRDPASGATSQSASTFCAGTNCVRCVTHLTSLPRCWRCWMRFCWRACYPTAATETPVVDPAPVRGTPRVTATTWKNRLREHRARSAQAQRRCGVTADWPEFSKQC